MSQKCSFIEKCPIAKYFGRVGWSAVGRRYCHEGKFDECQRRQLRLAGKSVPDNLFPWDTPPSNARKKNEADHLTVV